MAAITVRNIPEDLYATLKTLAEKNHRSLQQQILTILESVRGLNVRSPIDRADAIRDRLAGRDFGSIVADIREDRER